MVVDDSRFLITILSKTFVSMGFDVVTAETMEEGLRKLEENPPDLLFLDINLPDASGAEACRCLKDEARWAGLPIILISSSNEDWLRAKVAETGADGYIKKPFSPGSLVRWFQNHGPRLLSNAGGSDTGRVDTASAKPSRRKAKEIVVVDDSAFLCSILKDTLTRAGFRVFVCDNVRDMGRFLHDNEADLVFLDINLPDVSGDTACRILKESPRTKALPVILISAQDEFTLRDIVRSCGANGYLRKPFTPLNVLEWIKRNAVALFGHEVEFGPLKEDDDVAGGAISDEARTALETSPQVDILIEQLESPSPDVAREACYSLGELRVRRAVEPVSALLYGGDETLQAEAAWALGEIGDKGAVQPLLTMLAKQNPYLRERAVEALGKIKAPEAVPPLVEMLKVGRHDMRILAIKALAEIGHASAVEHLEGLVIGERDDEVKANAQWAIQTIDEKTRFASRK